MPMDTAIAAKLKEIRRSLGDPGKRASLVISEVMKNIRDAQAQTPKTPEITAQIKRLVNSLYEQRMADKAEAALKEPLSLDALNTAVVAIDGLLSEREKEVLFPLTKSQRDFFQTFCKERTDQLKKAIHHIEQSNLIEQSQQVLTQAKENPAVLFDESEDCGGIEALDQSIHAFLKVSGSNPQNSKSPQFFKGNGLGDLADAVAKKAGVWLQEEIIRLEKKALESVRLVAVDHQENAEIHAELDACSEKMDRCHKLLKERLYVLNGTEIPAQFTDRVNARTARLSAFIKASLDDGQAVNDRKKREKKLKEAKPEELEKFPEEIKGLKYAGEPATPARLAGISLGLIVGSLAIATSVTWSAASICSSLGSMIPALFQGLMLMDPGFAAGMAVLCVLAVVAVVFSARFANHDRKAKSFYARLNAFETTQAPSKLLEAYEEITQK